ncbi:MAG: energy-coupling factor ABC transporter ATP-binding protein [Candidatus Hydrogenedentes bacterium]|nr:energy-coupling factor ABC transporter ATP-binding protein [Candidatus Hydrogenedentota bacterium]
MSEATIELCSIDFAYSGAAPLFEQFDLSLMPGERIALAGDNGSGKSTLLHIITGLLRPQQGVVRAFDKRRAREADFREVRRRAGYLLQDSDDQLFCPTVLDDVMFGPLNFGLSRAQAHERALRILGELGLPDHGARVTYKLSGGEKRLVALASVLAMEPDVLLLDEPTAGLDVRTEERLVEILQALRQDMILVSHNQAFVDKIATRRVTLRG